uniref:Uncharacterized protein n=1 Tax=Romanomermis culicivorax TaxID=13658 RepID=A0A915K8M3_ROMCU
MKRNKTLNNCFKYCSSWNSFFDSNTLGFQLFRSQITQSFGYNRENTPNDEGLNFFGFQSRSYDAGVGAAAPANPICAIFNFLQIFMLH